MSPCRAAGGEKEPPPGAPAHEGWLGSSTRGPELRGWEDEGGRRGGHQRQVCSCPGEGRESRYHLGVVRVDQAKRKRHVVTSEPGKGKDLLPSKHGLQPSGRIRPAGRFTVPVLR